MSNAKGNHVATAGTTKPAMPNRHKLAVLILIGVYPIITIMLAILGPLTSNWMVWQKTLILAPIMVLIMVYLLIPFITKYFRGFLMSPKN